MDINGLLDCQITIEGEKLPTVREIIESHFASSARGNAAMGKMIAAQYVAYLKSMSPSGVDAGQTAAQPQQKADADPKGEGDAPNPQPQKDAAASGGKRIGSDAEALLKSMGVPVGADGGIDIMGAITGAFSPEGSKTPLGTIVGTVMRTLGEAQKPRS